MSSSASGYYSNSAPTAGQPSPANPTMTVNGYQATQYLQGSWAILTADGQQWYWQGNAQYIANKLMSMPAVPAANSTLMQSPNVTNNPDGSTQIRALQQAVADRIQRRQQLEPDYIEPEELAAYSNGNPGATAALQQLETSVQQWNAGLNDLRAQCNLSPLPASAFDGAPAVAPTTSLPSWLGLGAVAVIGYMLWKK